MAKYLFVYHGGSMPESEAAQAEMMEKWSAWFGSFPASIVDGGNPVGASITVSAGGVASDGGSNPASGYSIIDASDLDDATAKAKGCPIIEEGGTVEVAPIIDLG